jgi:hypothetical protein
MFSNRDLSAKHGQSATMGFGTWMAFDCLALLNFIPIIGSIALIVIYLVLLFSDKTAPSLKNRIIANLVWAVVVIGAFIVLMLTGLLASVTQFAASQVS